MSVCPNCGFSEPIATQQDPPLHLKNTASDPWRQLTLLDVEIEGLHQLEQDRVSLKRKINSSSPILQLPSEISSEIFSAYLGGQSLQDDPESELESPLFLGRICSAWRELAWSIPSLWCSVDLNFEQRKINPLVVDQWLIRSHTLPLSIRILVRDGIFSVANVLD